MLKVARQGLITPRSARSEARASLCACASGCSFLHAMEDRWQARSQYLQEVLRTEKNSDCIQWFPVFSMPVPTTPSSNRSRKIYRTSACLDAALHLRLQGMAQGRGWAGQQHCHFRLYKDGLARTKATSTTQHCLAWAGPRSLGRRRDVGSSVLASEACGALCAASAKSTTLSSSMLRRALSGHLAYWQLPEPTSVKSEQICPHLHNSKCHDSPGLWRSRRTCLRQQRLQTVTEHLCQQTPEDF